MEMQYAIDNILKEYVKNNCHNYSHKIKSSFLSLENKIQNTHAHAHYRITQQTKNHINEN